MTDQGPAEHRPRGMKLAMAALALVVVTTLATRALAYLKFMSSSYQAAASMHALEARAAEESLSKVDTPQAKGWLMEMIRFHKRMEQKYRTAAGRPWVRTPLDPSPPPFPYAPL